MAAALFLSSCAGLVGPPGGADAERLAALVNSGTPEALSQSSSLPFLVDQEIVSLKGDVAAFWKAVRGVRLELAVIPGFPAPLVTGDTYKDFGASFETRVFFKKYLPREARLYTFTVQGGKRVMLIAKDDLFSRTVYGLKGPF